MNEPMQMGERVEDFLPPPSQLVKRESASAALQQQAKRRGKG
jgi:hypothetical protein